MNTPVLEFVYEGWLPFLGLLLILCAVEQLRSFMSARLEQMPRAYRVGAALLFIPTFFLLVCIGFVNRWRESWLYQIEFAEQILSMPLWAYLLVLAAITAGTTVLVWQTRRWGKEHLTPSSVKEAFDLLPASVAFVDSENRPVLVNLAMDQLSLEVLGRSVVDVEDLWSSLQMKSDELLGEDEFILRPEPDRVLLMRRERVEAAGDAYAQLSSVDITNEHTLARQLRAQNAELRAVRRRMRTYGENVRQIAREQELLDARVMVHDEMGHVLLATSYWLEHPESYDASRLLAQWDGVLARMLESMGHQAEHGVAELAEIVDESVQLGVEVHVEGDLPADAQAQDIVLRALRESVANCVRHARGSRLWLRLEPRAEGRVRARLWNDGAVPTETVQERGGLRSLRQAVERAGGTMTVQSMPTFQLELDLPA